MLVECIAEFPQNTIFLSLYARFRNVDRIRAILRDVLPSERSVNDSIVAHFFAVQTELARGVEFGSSQNAIRTTFERAVGSESAGHCPRMWQLYLAFELSTGSLPNAKSVFYRATQACPWVKDMNLFCFENLGNASDGTSWAESKAILHLMSEKGLRLHNDCEEVMT